MKSSFLVLLAIAVLSIFVSTPAEAQYSSRLKGSADAIDPDVARQFQREIAQCMYRRHSDQSERLLRHSDFMNIDLAGLGVTNYQLWHALDMEKCGEDNVPVQYRSMMISYSPESIRKMLVEAAYVANRSRPFSIGEADEVFLTSRPFVEMDGVNDARILAGFADCVVHRAPVETDRLVRTTPGTRKEAEAIEAVIPHLGPCLEDGNNISLSVDTVRALIADGLWARHAYSSGTVASN
ncbi:hypothetical protein WJT74_03585 [Sphingomicrobium sp. XHP0239]|uniref:hypothetical protein n=1 Tax=Sphingomicrobium maritimum TaxID=3133972 RepID=UPI0031CC62B5